MFTKHSGGTLTTDVVNEMLKDCDTVPIIGIRTGTTRWNHLDYDKTFYYHEVSYFSNLTFVFL